MGLLCHRIQAAYLRNLYAVGERDTELRRFCRSDLYKSFFGVEIFIVYDNIIVYYEFECRRRYYSSYNGC